MMIRNFIPATFEVLIGGVVDFDLPGRYFVPFDKYLPMFRCNGPPSFVGSSSLSLAPQMVALRFCLSSSNIYL